MCGPDGGFVALGARPCVDSSCRPIVGSRPACERETGRTGVFRPAPLRTLETVIQNHCLQPLFRRQDSGACIESYLVLPLHWMTEQIHGDFWYRLNSRSRIPPVHIDNGSASPQLIGLPTDVVVNLIPERSSQSICDWFEHRCSTLQQGKADVVVLDPLVRSVSHCVQSSCSAPQTGTSVSKAPILLAYFSTGQSYLC